MQAKTIEDAFREICAADWPLEQRLDAFSKALRELSLPFAEAYDDLVNRLKSADAGYEAPAPEGVMPSFLLPDASGRLVGLDSLLEQGPLVVSFNRGHWCEYCEIELIAFREAMSEIVASGANVVAIMPDASKFTAKVADQLTLPFPILSDVDNGYALSLGLVIWLGERVRKLYQEHGLDLDRYQGNSMWFLPIPATFVVGREGKVLARYIDPDFRNRMEIKDILSVLAAVQA